MFLANLVGSKFKPFRKIIIVLLHRMSVDMTALEESFRQKNQSCFILGASGETGRILLQELVQRNIFSKITLIGRRQLTLEDKTYENLVSNR